MTLSTVWLVLLAALATLATTAQAQGPPAYLYVTEPATFADAEADARARGGQLVSIASAAEEAEVLAASGNQTTWLGFTDREQERDFVWTDGTAVTYTNWASGEPNDAAFPDGEDCAELRDTGGGFVWNDAVCTEVRPYVVDLRRRATVTSSEYVFVGEAMPFADAEAVARTLGGRLVSIASAEEESEVFDQAGGFPFWIGLSDRQREGAYAWPDGTAPTYTNWAPGEPNDGAGGEDCVEVAFGMGAPRWNDRDCAAPRPFVVEIERTLLVDTADEQPYVAGPDGSLADCTDGVLDGDCALGEAIAVANAEAAYDRIAFEISMAYGARPNGLAVVGFAVPLPAVTDAGVTIDGQTQPGWVAATASTPAAIKVELYNAASNSSVLTLRGPDVTVRGLSIGWGSTDGIAVEGARAVVTGNHIGVSADGTTATRNRLSGVYVAAAGTDARIGTDGDGVDDAAERNVISGNGAVGVTTDGARTVIAGNYIGTNAAGTAALGNGATGEGYGVWARNGADARIGTAGDGTADDAERNVISGNRFDGVRIDPGGASAVIAGNHIGTDAAGAAAVANGRYGVAVEAVSGVAASNVRIGTDGDGAADAAERNVISGNGPTSGTTGGGIRATLASSTPGFVVAGNYVGTDATGTVAIANRGIGVFTTLGVGTRIGTDGNGTADAAERNVVSGNLNNGIHAFRATQTVIAGNYVGTDATGTAALPNTNHGIVAGGLDVRVGTNGDGTADAAERNVASGNGVAGIILGGLQSSGAIAAGNYVGTDATGTAPLPNASYGIDLFSDANARIGSNGDGVSDAAEGNRVAYNGSVGIRLPNSGARASILGNAIYQNGGLGIDLVGGPGAGVTPNDADDADTGTNGLQNFPVITEATTASVAFSLDSRPSRTFRVELFASATADATGYGEGARYLGFTNVTTDATGDATGTFAPVGLAVGEVVTATATPVTVDGAGNVTGYPDTDRTSEFSLAVAVAGPVAAVTLEGTDGWRMLAAPQDTTVGAFLAPLWTQGFPGADSEAGDCTVFTFDEAAPTFAEGWTCVGGAADPLPAGVGVMAYVFADDDPRSSAPGVQGGFPKTITAASAVEAPASFAFDVAFTDDGRASTQKGWTLLGAPSGASLDWADLDRTGVRSTVYVYDPAYNGGDYRTATVDGGVTYGDLAGGIVPSFQGFFVQALAPAPSLVATAASAESGRDVYGRQAAPAVVRLAVSDAEGERSAAWLSLGAGALGLDAADAPRLQPTAWPRAVVYTTAPDAADPLVANALPRDLDGQASVDVPLDVDVAGFDEAVALTLSADGLDALPDGWAVTLVDRLTGAETDLAAGYTFTVEGSDAARRPASARTTPAALAASPAARFALRLGSASAVATDDDPVRATALAAVSPNPAAARTTVRWTLAEAGPARVSVVDLLGREVAVLADGALAAGLHRADLDAGALAPGVYVVRLQAGATVEALRFTVAR